jgi:hypothetical protein
MSVGWGSVDSGLTAHVVVQQPVAADGLEAKLIRRKLEVVAPVSSRAQEHVPRADAPLPVLGKWSRDRRQVNEGVDIGRGLDERDVCKHNQNHRHFAQ